MCVHTTAYIKEVTGEPMVVSSLYYMGPGNGMQVARLSNRQLYLQSHLSDFLSVIKKVHLKIKILGFWKYLSS